MNHYETTDLTLTTVLVCQGYPIDSIDKHDPRKAIFFFRREEGLEQVIEGYWTKVLRIEPSVFATTQRMIKQRLYNT